MVESAKPGVSVLSLCEKGDAYIMTETGKVFKKEKEMKKGEEKMARVSLFLRDSPCWTPTDECKRSHVGNVFVCESVQSY